jgi:glycosyltransferase involved in cell wall biosynthesis
MKIVMVHSYFPPKIDSIGNIVYNLAKSFSEDGHNVVVLTSQLSNKSSFNDDVFKVFRLNPLFKVANTPIIPGLPKALMEHLKEADIVHTHLPTPFSSDVTMLTKHIRSVPAVLTYHCDIVGYRPLEKLIANVYTKTLLSVTLSLADKIVALTKTYSEMSTFLRKFRRKIEIIPNGVDDKVFAPVSEKEKIRIKERLNINSEKIILFVGLLDRFHAYKGLHYLIASSKKVVTRLKSLKFIVVGEGELRAFYQQMCKDLKVNDYFVFTGLVSREMLLLLYKIADLFVLPSTTLAESFPLVLLEAMSSGLPIITTTIGALPEIVGYGKAAKLVRPRDSEELAEAILQLITNEELAKEYGKNSRRMVLERYSWRIVYQKYKLLFERLVGDRS